MIGRHPRFPHRLGVPGNKRASVDGHAATTWRPRARGRKVMGCGDGSVLTLEAHRPHEVFPLDLLARVRRLGDKWPQLVSRSPPGH